MHIGSRDDAFQLRDDNQLKNKVSLCFLFVFLVVSTSFTFVKMLSENSLSQHSNENDELQFVANEKRTIEIGMDQNNPKLKEQDILGSKASDVIDTLEVTHVNSDKKVPEEEVDGGTASQALSMEEEFDMLTDYIRNNPPNIGLESALYENFDKNFLIMPGHIEINLDFRCTKKLCEIIASYYEKTVIEAFSNWLMSGHDQVGVEFSECTMKSDDENLKVSIFLCKIS